MKLNRRQFVAGLGALSFLKPQALLLAQNHSVSLQRAPYLQAMRQDGVTIMWTTLEPGDGYVQYSSYQDGTGIAAAQQRTFFPAETGMPFTYVQYEAKLTGLRPNTNYRYSAVVDGQTIGDAGMYGFRTAGPGLFDLSFSGTADKAATSSLPSLHALLRNGHPSSCTRETLPTCRVLSSSSTPPISVITGG